MQSRWRINSATWARKQQPMASGAATVITAVPNSNSHHNHHSKMPQVVQNHAAATVELPAAWEVPPPTWRSTANPKGWTIVCSSSSVGLRITSSSAGSIWRPGSRWTYLQVGCFIDYYETWWSVCQALYRMKLIHTHFSFKYRVTLEVRLFSTMQNFLETYL